MKNLLLLFLLISSVQTTHAQYKPLPMQNAEWYQDGGIALLSCPTCTFVNYKYYTDGDTLINAQTYVKIKKVEVPNINDVSLFPAYTGAIRQDTLNKKIYVVLTDSTTEHILYDFSLQVGDTNNSVLHTLASDCLGFNTETLYLIDTIQVNGNDHRVFHFQGSCTANGVNYIEGIGSDFGLLFPNLMDMEESHLNCLKINNQSYYPYANANCTLPTISVNNLDLLLDISLFPNPASETLTISLPENSLISEAQLFDAAGKELKRFTVVAGENRLNVAAFKTGTYLIQMGNAHLTFRKE
ncbi:MAG: hypothetical protein RL371_588 [Bacteroidota bacterium]